MGRPTLYSGPPGKLLVLQMASPPLLPTLLYNILVIEIMFKLYSARGKLRSHETKKNKLIYVWGGET